MTNIRRSVTTDSKLEAAQLVAQQRYSFAKASRSIGVGETALRRWVSQLQQESADKANLVSQTQRFGLIVLTVKFTN